MKCFVFFLEEPSAREMLQGLLPRILPDNIVIRYIVFKGKQDMEHKLTAKLRGWLAPDSVFVVIRDQDAADCHAVKGKLSELCLQANKNDTLIRVACHELESFYLGDLAAVEMGLKLKGLSSKQASRKYRTPDRLANPARELARLTNGKYQKIAGSRAIAPFLDPDNNKSHSFCVLIKGLRAMPLS